MEAVVTAPWRILLFGGLRAEQDGTSITKFRSQKIGALLAYLALFPNRAYTREELADLFWPDAEPEVARTNLRTALFSLRKQLEPPGSPTGSVLVTRGHSDVGIERRAVWTDVAAFSDAVRAASQDASAGERIALWEDAVALYAGPLLPGFNETWASIERARLAESYQRTLQRLVSHYQQDDAPDRALEFARLLVTADPLDENAHRDVIRLLMTLGQNIAARSQFEDMRRRFVSELGREPSPELAALLDRRSVPVKREMDSETDSGLGLPVVAVAAPPAETRTVPLPASAPAPLHLPLTMTRFFGREGERSHLADALRSSVRLVTLTGFGGCGKTRLSVETAREVASAFPGGVWFVPLAEVQDAVRIFDVVGDTLGIPRANTAEQTLDQIAARLNRMDARTLLVLDNFEQIVEDGATAVQTLLGRCPGLSCLVTSRHLLMLDGEQEVSLQPLPTPTLSATPERLLDFSSVQLFVNRAQAARPDFQLTSRNAAPVAQICARLEGIPLAIELAAAWSQTLTPAQILERLGRRFDLLISRRRDIPVRQATLHATIEWSYKLLPPNLQTFFTQLSVFRGGWTLEAAEAITEYSDTISSLAELEQRSLLVTEETDSASSMTFRMLEAVREFAAAQLLSTDADSAFQLRLRHAAFFADLAEQGEREFHGPDAVVWLDRLERDHDNFRAALEWVLDHGGHLDLGLRIAAGLHRFWYIRGYLSEGRGWLSKVLTVPVNGEPSAARAVALAAAAGLAGAEGDTEAADRLYTEALSVHRAWGNQRGIASSLCQLGLVVSARDDHPQARLLFEESLQISRDIGYEGNAAHVLKCLGCNALVQGETDKAESLFDESLAMYRRFGDIRGMAMVLGEIGQLALNYRSDYAKAAGALDEHLRLSRQINDVVHTARALSGLGRMAQIQGNFSLARKYLLESLSLFRARGYEREVLLLLRCFADLAVAQGQPGRAVRLEAAIAKAEDATRALSAEESTESGCPEPPPSQLRALLGSAAFEKAWAEGSRMTLDQAVTYTASDE